VLRYAARIFDLLETLGYPSPESAFLEILSEAHSNIPEFGNGADVYHRFSEPTRVRPQGVVANLAISSLVNHTLEKGNSGGFIYQMEDARKEEHGRFKLISGRVLLQEAMTRQHFHFAFAGLHLGGIDFYGALCPYTSKENYDKASKKLWEQFYSVSLPKLLRVVQEEFGPEEFGVEQLLTENKQMIFKDIYGSLVDHFSEQYVRLYEDNRRNLEMLQSVGFELPKEIKAAAEFTFGKLFEEEIQKKEWFKDPEAYRNMIELADGVTQHGYQIDRFAAEHTFRDLITEIVEGTMEKPTDENIRASIAVVQLAKKLGLSASLYLAQEAVFKAAETTLNFKKMTELSDLLELKTEHLIAVNEEVIRKAAGGLVGSLGS